MQKGTVHTLGFVKHFKLSKNTKVLHNIGLQYLYLLTQKANATVGCFLNCNRPVQN